MEDLEDELDLRHHKGLSPDVYYRCPTLESLDGALRNECERSASSLIPTEIVTEFIFAMASTITIPVMHQPSLDALIDPTNFPQSITVEHALCRDIDGKPRLKAQRAIAKSIIEAIQVVDGFRYIERRADNRDGADGTRLKYVCQDSAQHRKTRNKKETFQDSGQEQTIDYQNNHNALPMYECGGAIHVKFSTKRDAIHVVYKHNPIHDHATIEESSLPALQLSNGLTEQSLVSKPPKEAKKKRARNSRDFQLHVDDELQDPNLDMSTSPEAPKTKVQRKRKKSDMMNSSDMSRKSSMKKTKATPKNSSPSRSRKQATFQDPPQPPRLVEGKACIRCHEKKIKCNGAKPACNQCKRGLWTCQYQVKGSSKRSKNGCIGCKQRRRKCTEEKPSCTYCLRIDEDCEYADQS
ncbi:hypothetical protein ACN47E_008469 [Coniothyrium glycines]